MRRVPLALLGTGWVVEHAYLPPLLAGPFEVVAVHDPDEARAARVAHRVGAHVCTTAEACLETRAEAFLVCVPPVLHAQLLPALLARGRAVLCEKPVASDERTVEALRAAGPGARLMGSATMRFRKDVQALCTWAASGRLGELKRLRLGWWRHRGVPAPGSWRTDPRVLPGGVLDDLGPHLLDLATALLPPEVCQAAEVRTASLECRYGAAAHGASWFTAGTGEGSYTVPDQVHAELDVPGGPHMELSLAWADELPGDFTRIEVVGSEGTAVLEGLFGFSTARRVPYQECQRMRSGRLEEHLAFKPGPSLQAEAFAASLEQFARFATDQGEPVAAMTEVLQVGHWLDAIRRRATTREAA